MLQTGVWFGFDCEKEKKLQSYLKQGQKLPEIPDVILRIDGETSFTSDYANFWELSLKVYFLR